MSGVSVGSGGGDGSGNGLTDREHPTRCQHPLPL
jgi:hypothetical protein